MFLLKKEKIMNTRTYLTAVDIPSLVQHMHRASVGFDSMFDKLHRNIANVTNYPPHDIIKHSDSAYSIELAVAGFKESELAITVEDNILTITGNKVDRPDREYVHQGISAKAFTKVIPLAEHVAVKGAAYEDGLLIVNVEIEVPEMLKPRKIEIASTKQIEVK
jgi:molecular chaperone IbpA